MKSMPQSVSGVTTACSRSTSPLKTSLTVMITRETAPPSRAGCSRVTWPTNTASASANATASSTSTHEQAAAGEAVASTAIEAIIETATVSGTILRIMTPCSCGRSGRR